MDIYIHTRNAEIVDKSGDETDKWILWNLPVHDGWPDPSRWGSIDSIDFLFFSDWGAIDLVATAFIDTSEP